MLSLQVEGESHRRGAVSTRPSPRNGWRDSGLSLQQTGCLCKGQWPMLSEIGSL